MVLIRKGTLVIDMTLATEDEKKSQRDWLARCYGADQPSPSASGQPSSREGEGDSGESGPLATSTLPWGDPAKARDMAQEFFHTDANPEIEMGQTAVKSPHTYTFQPTGLLNYDKQLPQGLPRLLCC